jgi:hypothetical protein
LSINNNIINDNIAFNSYFISYTEQTLSDDAVRVYDPAMQNHVMTNDNDLEWMWEEAVVADCK